MGVWHSGGCGPCGRGRGLSGGLRRTLRRSGRLVARTASCVLRGYRFVGEFAGMAGRQVLFSTRASTEVAGRGEERGCAREAADACAMASKPASSRVHFAQDTSLGLHKRTTEVVVRAC